MAQFPTAGHLASWAGLCPGNNESAGKRRSGRTTKGSVVAADDAGAGGVGGEPHQADDPGGDATGRWRSGWGRRRRWSRWVTRSCGSSMRCSAEKSTMSNDSIPASPPDGDFQSKPPIWPGSGPEDPCPGLGGCGKIVVPEVGTQAEERLVRHVDRPPRGQRAAGHPPVGDDPPRADAGDVPQDVRRRSASCRSRPRTSSGWRSSPARGPAPTRSSGRSSTSPTRGATPGELALRFDLTVPLARFVAKHVNELGTPVQAVRDRLGLPRRAARQGAVPRVRPVRLRHRRHREPRGRRRDRPGDPRGPRRRPACPAFTITLNNRKILDGMLDTLGRRRPDGPGPPVARQARQDRPRGGRSRSCNAARPKATRPGAGPHGRPGRRGCSTSSRRAGAGSRSSTGPRVDSGSIPSGRRGDRQPPDDLRPARRRRASPPTGSRSTSAWPGGSTTTPGSSSRRPSTAGSGSAASPRAAGTTTWRACSPTGACRASGRRSGSTGCWP